MSRPTVVILAAGKGKRMYSRRPKVLHTIGNEPMLEHVIRTARSLSPQRLIIVYGHGGDQVRQAFADQQDLVWVEQSEQLGTGHALKMALPQLPADGTTLVLYGDVPLTRVDSLQGLLAAAGDGMAVLTDHVTDASGYGRIVRDTGGVVCAIVEERDCTPQQRAIREINTGILALPNARLAGWLMALGNDNAQGEYYLTDVVAMAHQQAVAIGSHTVRFSYEAAGINNKLQQAELERIYQHNQARRLMEQGVTLLDPARVDIRGQLRCGQDVEIDIGCLFEGEVELGDNVRVGAHCVLKNVRIAADTVIAPYSLLEDSTVGSACRVGPYARLRPGSQLGEHVHIGNFVEIKNSCIDDASKVNHLTYVGDSDIGRQVNVGAGCVTVNYDGVNKYRTVIKDQAFIGSGALLVAPLTVESGATIGAGSVITRDAPADKLTLARARQVSVDGWQRPLKKTTK